MEFDDLCSTYLNTAKKHGEIFDRLYEEVQQTPWLKEHRDWVEANSWGMGDRPHHAMWRAIVETMPHNFKALEIGVYRGQAVSLIGLIAMHLGKTPSIYGISPFSGTDDTVNSYSKELNYLADVETIFRKFQVPCEWFYPIRGMSQHPEVIADATRHAPYDILYIDGCHEYEAVKQDIQNCADLLRSGGILVMDDASCHLQMPEFTNTGGYNRCWPGVRSVSDAVLDYLEPRKDFVHRFAVGHNRIFVKL